MAEENKFSVISVDSSFEDEEVIHVNDKGVTRGQGGVSTNGAAVGPPSEAPAGTQDTQTVSPAPATDAKNTASDMSDTNRSASVPISGQPNTNPGATAPTATKKEKYREQTLEDLDEPVPYAGMKRIILGILAILVVAFVVYFAIGM